MTEFDVKEDDIVVIREFEEYPEHLFRVSEVFDDCVRAAEPGSNVATRGW